ncbi:MAG TPA: hypothetical protein DEB46_07675 [Myxococcales bacterium]|nr:hypothetical protein [Myxococcales bacterium]HBU48178.1 hypothetical protein [Myxococcales bacterium]
MLQSIGSELSLSNSLPQGLFSVSWDLDGTFADTSVDLARALNQTRAEKGMGELPIPDVARHVGKGAKWLVQNCLDPGLDPDEIEATVQRFLAYYLVGCSQMTKAYPGVIEYSRALRAAGIKQALATNKPRRFTERILSDLGWNSLFDSVHCGDDGRAKPDPEMLNHCIQSLGSRAEQHLHLGDTPTDAAAANAAGCLFLGVRWGMDGGEGLMAEGVEPLFASLAELAAHMETL